MRDFIAGIRYVLESFDIILKPGVRLYVLIPLLINSMLFAGAIIYGVTLMEDFINTWLTGWWEWLRWLLWPLFVILAMTIMFSCFTIVANLLAAPFNGFLAAAVEFRITGIKPGAGGGLSRLPAEIKKAALSETKKFLYIFLRIIPLLLLFLIPLVQLAAPFIWILFIAWMLALEYLDYPLGNHDIGFTDQKAMLWQKRQLALGFGMGVLLLTMIPVLNFLAIPVGVCAATRLYIDRLRSPDA